MGCDWPHILVFNIEGKIYHKNVPTGDPEGTYGRLIHLADLRVITYDVGCKVFRLLHPVSSPGPHLHKKRKYIYTFLLTSYYFSHVNDLYHLKTKINVCGSGPKDEALQGNFN